MTGDKGKSLNTKYLFTDIKLPLRLAVQFYNNLVQTMEVKADKKDVREARKDGVRHPVRKAV